MDKLGRLEPQELDTILLQAARKAVWDEYNRMMFLHGCTEVLVMQNGNLPFNVAVNVTTGKRLVDENIR